MKSKKWEELKWILFVLITGIFDLIAPILILIYTLTIVLPILDLLIRGKKSLAYDIYYPY